MARHKVVRPMIRVDPVFPGRPLRLVVLASGEGTLFQSLLDARRETPSLSVQALVTDKPCPAIDRAHRADIPVATITPPRKNAPATPEDHPATCHQDTYAERRRQWNSELAQAVQQYDPDIVVSAGFMRIVGDEFLARFGGRMTNTHPALLPSFPGAHAVADAVAYGAKITGSTIHLVDSGVDTGPILDQEAVPIHDGDTPDTVHRRIKTVERRLLVSTLDAIARRGYISDGRKASFLP
ncbi:phosphoribosylglycinamide formyltransferase [Corynebacterium sp. MC-04]|nr:phosphoribosylglycinamide formyltransferase [Corynebacterium parakroppenstedtii]MDU3198210.1 phosphoribosylglycinamide formyltransferase [Corynebacterium kroppenstedtii]MBY0788908.1 phosphoribosylglycinamide formyltransferase [Corynebacterium parakroppenstedtii]MBY0792971.1 phosphoribosylglycinamide formyltransferase [Corynebacterium parakroppenstedtii]MCF6771883.1 phosphoribosylglycinamide formyltransferase [Corynebacterium parakroppenstedtii]MCF6779167.1 phosphoribosylglycinamide formyltr